MSNASSQIFHIVIIFFLLTAALCRTIVHAGEATDDSNENGDNAASDHVARSKGRNGSKCLNEVLQVGVTESVRCVDVLVPP